MKITVCIVEDDAELRGSISAYINANADFECLGAYGSAEEALAQIPRQKPSIVVMDIHLPGMDGIECVKKLAEVFPSAQILMLTVYENTNQIFDALTAGACGYLLKSTRPQLLLEAIREIHRGGSPMTSHIARKVVQAFRPTADKTTHQLSAREQDVLALLSRGYPYKQIADDLGLSLGTVRTYIRRIYEKLHVKCRTDAVVKYLGDAPQARRPSL